MKKQLIRGILFILLMTTFFMIFGFSSQNAEKSGGISTKITQTILTKIASVQALEKKEQEAIQDRVEKIIRKIAHFSVYTLVGILLMGLVSTYSLKELDQMAISIILGILYATSDEIHQSFIPGRSAQLTDVMLDSMGVLLGILLVIAMIKVKKEKGRKVKNVSMDERNI